MLWFFWWHYCLFCITPLLQLWPLTTTYDYWVAFTSAFFLSFSSLKAAIQSYLWKKGLHVCWHLIFFSFFSATKQLKCFEGDEESLFKAYISCHLITHHQMFIISQPASVNFCHKTNHVAVLLQHQMFLSSWSVVWGFYVIFLCIIKPPKRLHIENKKKAKVLLKEIAWLLTDTFWR